MDHLAGGSTASTRFLRDMWQGTKPKSEVVANADNELKELKGPDFFALQLAIGRYFTHSKQDTDSIRALKYLEGASTLDPAEFEPHLEILRFATHKDHRMPELMREQAGICLSMRPDIAAMWVWKGIVIREYDTSDPDRLPKSRKCFEKAIELDPSREDAHLFVGMVYYDLQKTELAEKAFDLAASLPSINPERRGEISTFRGLVRATLGKWKLAREDYEIAAKDKFVQSDAPFQYNLACTVSLMSASVSRDESLSETDRTRLGRELKTAAIQHAADAIRLGFNKPEHLKMFKTDKDFEPIRSEPEFQSLFRDK